MDKLTIFDVANWFVKKRPTTHKKIQKLCYYAYCWSIYYFNDNINDLKDKLFDAKFEAWVHGAVNKELYDELKGNGMDIIKEVPCEKSDITDLNSLEFLEDIYEAYGNLSAYELENINHSESPWKNARGNCSPSAICTTYISEEDMYQECAKALANEEK